MNSFDLNKILGAILGTLLFVMGIGFVAEAIYQPAHGPGPGLDLPGAEETTTADTTTTTPAAPADIGTLLAAADIKAGEAAAKKCASCHDFTSGGPNKVGPNLYDVVDRQIAGHPGFGYSEALKAHSADAWTYANLDAWLLSPKAFANGTKMTFAGIKDDAERANVIAYLGSLSASPKPYPTPAAPAADTGAAPAAETVDATSSAAPVASEAPAAEAPASSEAPAASSEAAPAASSSEAAPAPSSSEAAPASSDASSSAAQ